jgi:Na+/H+-dicarboxylate symporter
VVNQVIQLGYKAIVIILHWIIDLVPFAVLCTVAAEVGPKGFGVFRSLAWFIVAVLVALALQATWYLVRIRLGSWVRPLFLLNGMKDALTMAFSTSSSTATMPVTYAALRERVGLREDSASMGALVGSNFNNDGTALYEAMAALFIAQMIGQDLSLTQQAIVVVMSVIAAVGAAGIPEAGLVTMTLVFSAVNLPIAYIFLLLPVDWFLDRCRTVINVMGDVNVACLLEGTERTEPPPEKRQVDEPVAELMA